MLVHAAGWDEIRPFVESDSDFIEKIVRINLIGCVAVVRAFLPGMLDAGRGRIVTVASDAGRVGSSGRSTGPHLHHEVFRDGRRVNPWKYLGQRGR